MSVDEVVAGEFAWSQEWLTQVVAELGSEQAGGCTHAELAKLLTARSRELVRSLLQDHLDLRGGA